MPPTGPRGHARSERETNVLPVGRQGNGGQRRSPLDLRLLVRGEMEQGVTQPPPSSPHAVSPQP
jgi:hypothetical protein